MGAWGLGCEGHRTASISCHGSCGGAIEWLQCCRCQVLCSFCAGQQGMASTQTGFEAELEALFLPTEGPSLALCLCPGSRDHCA